MSNMSNMSNLKKVYIDAHMNMLTWAMWVMRIIWENWAKSGWQFTLPLHNLQMLACACVYPEIHKCGTQMLHICHSNVTSTQMWHHLAHKCTSTQMLHTWHTNVTSSRTHMYKYPNATCVAHKCYQYTNVGLDQLGLSWAAKKAHQRPKWTFSHVWNPCGNHVTGFRSSGPFMGQQKRPIKGQKTCCVSKNQISPAGF